MDGVSKAVMLRLTSEGLRWTDVPN